MSAAAQAPSASVSRKWIAKARKRSRQLIAMGSSVVGTDSRPQALVLLRSRLGIEAPFARGARRAGGVAFLRHHERAPYQVEQAFLGDAPVLLLAARLARHDQQLAGVGDPLARELPQPRLHVIAQRGVARQRKTQLHGR